MNYKPILQATLCIGISASVLISSPTGQARPTKFVGADSRYFYFHMNGTIFYQDFSATNSASHCGFTNPAHLDAYRSVKPGNVMYKDLSNNSRYTGPCKWPDGFYKLEGKAPIYYLSRGNSACWVRSFERLAQLGGSEKVRTVPASSNLFIYRSYSERC